jgi:hypothetical protein
MVRNSEREVTVQHGSIIGMQEEFDLLIIKNNNKTKALQRTRRQLSTTVP